MSLLRAMLNPAPPMSAATGDVSDQRSMHWWGMDFPTNETTSGARVSETTAMGLSAWFACIRCISEDAAKLPFGVFRKLERGRERVRDHPVDRLLSKQANDEMTAYTVRETLFAHALGWGDGYAEISRGDNGEAVALYPMDPSRVKVQRNGNRAAYVITNEDQTTTMLRGRNVIHLHGLSYTGGKGYSMIRLAREAVGAALAAQQHASAFFGNDATPSVALEHPGVLSDDAVKRLRASWEERHSGATNSYKPDVLEEGMQLKQYSVDPNKAQLLQTRQFGVEEVARFFRMPLHKIGHLLRSTFSNIEQQALEYVTDTLMPWLVRAEQEFALKLLSEDDLFTRHNVTALLRGDAAARASYYNMLFMIGALSINDIRELEDMNPIDNGDEHYVPLNMRNVQEPEPAQVDTDTASPTEPAANRVVVRSAVDRILTREKRALTTAASKRDDDAAYDAWASRFFGQHRRMVSQALQPAAIAMANLVGGDVGAATERVERFAADYEKYLQRAVSDTNGDLARWADQRTGAAEELTDQVMRTITPTPTGDK